MRARARRRRPLSATTSSSTGTRLLTAREARRVAAEAGAASLVGSFYDAALSDAMALITDRARAGKTAAVWMPGAVTRSLLPSVHVAELRARVGRALRDLGYAVTAEGASALRLSWAA